MSRWFRHYAGMMRDEKLVRVAIKTKQPIERILWVWGAILESAAEIDDDGRYDLDPAEVAYFLRADESDVSAVLAALADAQRVAENRVVHWGDRQFTSDRSAARVAAHRERKRAEIRGTDVTKRAGNGDVTLHGCDGNAPETETETETEAKKEKSNYAFSGRVIRLTRPDLGRWEKAYPLLDLPALLQSRDDWLHGRPEPERKNWFNSTSNWLSRKQQEVKLSDRPAEYIGP